MVNKKIIQDYYRIYKSKKCAICKSPIEKNFHFYSEILCDNFEGTVKIYNCQNCGTGYTYPFLSEKKLKKIYVNYDSHTHDNKISKNILFRIFKTIESKVFILCLKSNSPNFNKLTTSFIFQRFFQTFPLHTTQKNRKIKILDIGCGGGYFLQLAQKSGCEVYGTEIDRNLVKTLNSYGINAYLSIDPLIKRKIKFDIIRLNHVVEHLVNPNTIIRKIKKISDKNTEIIIGVPNYKTPAKIFKKYMFMHIPFHRLHLTPEGINYLLKNNGYKLIYFRTKSCGIFSWSLLRIFKLDKSKYRYLIKLLEMISLSLILDLLKIGDCQEIYTRKK